MPLQVTLGHDYVFVGFGWLPKQVISKRKFDDGGVKGHCYNSAYRTGSSYHRLECSPGLADMLELSACDATNKPCGFRCLNIHSPASTQYRLHVGG